VPFTSEARFSEWLETNSHSFELYLKVVTPVLVLSLGAKLIHLLSIYLPVFGLLFETLKLAKFHIIAFLAIALTLVLAFGVIGMLGFGHEIAELSHLGGSMAEVYSIFLG
jgi:hypothetical protein